MSEENISSDSGSVDLMSSFMQTQVAEQGNDTSKPNEKPKEKNALEKARDKEKEEKKKELEEAKKNSMYNVSKYRAAQANMMVTRSKNLVLVIPFIIAGVLVLLFVIKNGGSWVQGGTQFLVKKIRGE